MPNLFRQLSDVKSSLASPLSWFALPNVPANPPSNLHPNQEVAVEHPTHTRWGNPLMIGAYSCLNSHLVTLKQIRSWDFAWRQKKEFLKRDLQTAHRGLGCGHVFYDTSSWCRPACLENVGSLTLPGLFHDTNLWILQVALPETRHMKTEILIFVASNHSFLFQHLSKGCQLNPKGWWIDTP